MIEYLSTPWRFVSDSNAMPAAVLPGPVIQLPAVRHEIQDCIVGRTGWGAQLGNVMIFIHKRLEQHEIRGYSVEHPANEFPKIRTVARLRV